MRADITTVDSSFTQSDSGGSVRFPRIFGDLRLKGFDRKGHRDSLAEIGEKILIAFRQLLTGSHSFQKHSVPYSSELFPVTSNLLTTKWD